MEFFYTRSVMNFKGGSLWEITRKRPRSIVATGASISFLIIITCIRVALILLTLRVFLVFLACFLAYNRLWFPLALGFGGFILTVFIRKMPYQAKKDLARKLITTELKRKKLALFAVRIFTVLFTYYRLTLLDKEKLMSNIITILLKVRRRRRRKQNPEDEESSSACTSLWSKQLPEDIMQLILQRLPLSDYLQCSKVCVSWRATVKKAISSQLCRPLPQLPCLLLSSHHFSLNNHWFFSPSDQKFCKPSSPYIDRRNCIGSFEGWLIMSEFECLRPEGYLNPWSTDLLYMQNPPTIDSVIFFLNPISCDRVMLPSPSTISLPNNYEFFFFTKAVASSAPTSRHCFVAGLCTGNCHLAFCRPTDESWTLIKAEDIGELVFFDIEIIDAKLYAATWKEPEVSIVVFEIQDAGDANKPLSYRVESLNLLRSWPTPEWWMADGLHVNDGIYLAKDSSSKELFMIFHRRSFALEEDPIISWEEILYCQNFSIPPRTEGFRVFKLECNVNGSRWTEIEDLGDRILFISNFSNIFIPATNSLNLHNPDNSLGRNCIYFAFDNPCLSSSSSGRDVGVLSFEDRRVAHFSFSNDPSQTQLFTEPVWFTPNPW